MIAFTMIMRDVLGHGVPNVPFAKGNDAIEAFLFDGPDETLSVGIRIRRPPRGLHNPNAALIQQPPYLFAPFRVPVANQYVMRAQWAVLRHRQRAPDLPHE